MRSILGLAAKARSGKDTVATMLLAYPHVAAFALADPLKVGCQALFGLTDDETWDDSIKEQPLPLWGRSPREFFQTVGTEWMRNHNAEHWLMRAAREINPTQPSQAQPTRPLLPRAPNPSHATSGLIDGQDDAPFVMAAQVFFGFSKSTPDASASALKESLEAIDEYWGISHKQAVELLKHHALEMYPDFYERRSQRPVMPLKPRNPVPLDSEVIIIKDIRFENEAAFLRAHNGFIWHIKREASQAVNPHSSELGIEIGDDDIVILNDGTLTDLKLAVADAWKAQFHKPTFPQEK